MQHNVINRRFFKFFTKGSYLSCTSRTLNVKHSIATHSLFRWCDYAQRDHGVVTRDSKDVDTSSLCVVIQRKSRMTLGMQRGKALIEHSDLIASPLFQDMSNACSTTIWSWTTDRPRERPCYRKCLEVTSYSWARWVKIRSGRDSWRRRNAPRRLCSSLRKDTIRVSKVNSIVIIK